MRCTSPRGSAASARRRTPSPPPWRWEDALGITVSRQGRYLRDVIHACEFLQNHIRHFYLYTLPDFVRLPEGNALFETDHTDYRLPPEKNALLTQHYFDSLELSRRAHEMLAVLAQGAAQPRGLRRRGASAATQADIEGLKASCIQHRAVYRQRYAPRRVHYCRALRGLLENGRG
jgi:hydrogenase large subunit